MDQSLDRIAIVVQHEHNRIQTQLQHIGKGLHSEVQTTLAGDKDTSFVVAALFDGFERSHCSAGSISDTAEDCLVVHAGTTRELRAAKSECRCACFSDDEVARLEELAQSLGLR
jgi:hypothetical protein